MAFIKNIGGGSTKTVFEGKLTILPLSGFIRHAKGDDVVVTIDHEMDSRFGHLGFGNNRRAYSEARNLAKTLSNGEPVMIGLIDPVTGITKVLTREVIRGGMKHHLAIIFNADFSYPEDVRKGSFCLRMSERIDKNRVFTERIMYTPGKNIVWEKDQLEMLNKTRD